VIVPVEDKAILVPPVQTILLFASDCNVVDLDVIVELSTR
jgi:hypothetical protein